MSQLELFHYINAVCAQKVRIAFAEKGLQAREHLMTLRGDQWEPAYLKLNPNGVVPTLLHNGVPVIESSLILYYLDDVFPEPPLMPKDPLQCYRVRLFNKLIDEGVHDACTILTFATAFREQTLARGRKAWEAELAKAPSKKRSAYKRDVIEQGLASPYVTEAIARFESLIARLADTLADHEFAVGPAFTNADVALIPYFVRLKVIQLERMWQAYPKVADWVARMHERPSVKAAIFDRMSEADWAPFRSIKESPRVALAGV